MVGVIMDKAQTRRVLVTGSKGLIGTGLCQALPTAGLIAVPFDLRADGEGRGDVRVRSELHRAMQGCVGVVHLAAISRVVEAENAPDACIETNLGGTNNVLAAAESCEHSPWVIYASSREVYGNPASLPVREDMQLGPINVYGRCKLQAEERVTASGLSAAILRFSNVYGSPRDHTDRVIPAFLLRALAGEELSVEGSDNQFDFVHLDDAVRGILLTIQRLEQGLACQPVHLATGRGTTLAELAALAVGLAKSDSAIVEAPARTFDVARFCGEPSRAKRQLDWQANVQLKDGMRRLMEQLR